LLAVVLTILVGGCATDPVSDGPTEIGFALMPSEDWVFEQPSLWNQEEGMLELLAAGTPFEGVRRPFSVAHLTGTEELDDFHLTAQVKSTQDPEVIGRDVIIVFGYRSPSEFYYAHLSNDNLAAVHNGIFVVDHADRRRIDDQGQDNPPETRLMDTRWHQVRVDRNTVTGTIEVFLDDLRTPLMTATDTTFRSGAVGFGSFDDTGAIRNIHLEVGNGPLVDPIPGHVEQGSLTLALEQFALFSASEGAGRGLARLNYLGHAGDGSGRLFVNDLRGKLHVIEDGEVSVFLDVRDQFADFVDAPGLGSGFGFFAFHPDFVQNGKFYTIHTEAGDALETQVPDYSHQAGDFIQGVLTEWTATESEAPAFSGSNREVLRLGFPSLLHGLQQMGFNPTAEPDDEDFGLLYIGVGDGERPGFQTGNPQSLAAHTGKIYRIDPLGSDAPNGQYGIPDSNPFVSEPDALGEIWALGLRNPHRFSWDTLTGKMYISHIGEQNVDSIFPGRQGANYGWNLREGGFRYETENPLKIYPLSSKAADHEFTDPVARLDHDEMRALVGGFVYRGSCHPALHGYYLFADIVSGRIFYTSASQMEETGLNATIKEIMLKDRDGVVQSFEHFSGSRPADIRFGMDAEGEIYLLSKSNGSIWTIASASDDQAGSGRSQSD